MNSNEYGEPSSKMRKSIENEQNQIAAQNTELQPDIFKLNVDCFEEIFDYLSLGDLASFGRTCKRMQQVAGHWFRENYKERVITARSRCIQMGNDEEIKINCFSEYITSITFFGNTDYEYGNTDYDGYGSDSDDDNDTDKDREDDSSSSSSSDDDHHHNDLSDDNYFKNTNREYVEIANFIESIRSKVQSLLVYNYPISRESLNRQDFLQRYRYIQSNCSKSSINDIEFANCKITSSKIECIKNIMNGIDILQIENCYINGDVYKKILKFCSNLKILHVMKAIGEKNIIGNNNRWLQRRYPTLEHFILEPCVDQIDELWDFFNLNPNIRNFSTDSNCVLKNLDFFLKSNVTFDIFAICYLGRSKFNNRNSLNLICDILDKMYMRGFYKKVYFYFHKDQVIRQEDVNRLISVKALGKLCGQLSLGHISLSALTNLDELYIDDSSKVSDWEELTRNLPKLQRVCISETYIDHILILVSNAANLKGIMIGVLEDKIDCVILDIFTLNKKRKQLKNAHKVIIYIPEGIYIATKRVMNQTECSLIQIKRIDLCDWFCNFDSGLNYV